MHPRILFILGLASCGVLPARTVDQRIPSSGNPAEERIQTLILAQENAVLTRWYQGDPMGFIDNSWEGVSYFDPSLASRADGIEAFRKILAPVVGQIHVPAHRMEKPSVRIFGDLAVLTFTDVLDFGPNQTGRWHATEIYQRRGADWKLIHSHWTESKVK